MVQKQSVSASGIVPDTVSLTMPAVQSQTVEAASVTCIDINAIVDDIVNLNDIGPWTASTHKW